jgi:phage-related minor tail protein
MTNALRSEWTLDIQNFVASAKMAGNVTATETQRMQRQLDYITKSLAGMAKESANTRQLGEGFKASAEGAERSAGATAGMTRELLVLTHELSQGNYKRFGGSMLVLAEYSGTAKAALSTLVGPLGVVAAGVAGFTFAVISGAREQAEFNRMLVATNNAAGLTAGRFDAISEAAAKLSHSTIGASRDALMAVAGSGKFGPETITEVTQATLLMEKATGQSTAEVVKDFAKMRDGVAQWAAEHNKSMHFITAAQYEYVHKLEEQGRVEEAEKAVLALLNGQLGTVNNTLSATASWYEKVAEAASKAAKWVKDFGRGENEDQKVERLRAGLAKLQAEPSIAGQRYKGPDGNQVASRTAAIEAYTQALNAANEAQRMMNRGADAAAEHASVQGKAVEAQRWYDNIRESGKGMSALNKELDEARVHFKELADAGSPVPAKDQAEVMAKIKRLHQDPDARKLENEFKNTMAHLAEEGVRLDAERENWEKWGHQIDKSREALMKFETERGKFAKLSDANKGDAMAAAKADDLKDQAKREAEANAAIRQRIEALTAETAARKLSREEAYVAAGMAEKSIAMASKGSADRAKLAESLRQEFIATFATPEIDRWVASTNASVAAITAQTDALGQGTLAMQKSTDKANLLKEANAQIAKFPSQEARIWQEYFAAIEETTAARDEFYNKSRSADTGISKALASYKEAAFDQAKFTENLVSGSLKHAEDAFINLAKTGKLNLSSLFSFMAEEYLRNVFRMQTAKLLEGSGGIGNLFSGLSSIFSGKTTTGPFGVADMIGSFLLPTSNPISGAGDFARLDRIDGSHATGLSYVPYDGYMAELHEGEKVLTKQQARDSAGGASVVIDGSIGSIGAGVSLGQMNAAMKAWHSKVLFDLGRLQKQGRFA